jgi:hypothetical protein
MEKYSKAATALFCFAFHSGDAVGTIAALILEGRDGKEEMKPFLILSVEKALESNRSLDVDIISLFLDY